MTNTNPASRLEAFSDGVLAIIVTIMVLHLAVPREGTLEALSQLVPAFLAYVLSFVVLIIFWGNHHHLLRLVRRVTPGVMWANAALLFWLSLVPFATAWLGESADRAWPAAIYGLVLLLASISYYLLQTVIISHHGKDSEVARAFGRDFKGKISLGLYAFSVLAAFVNPFISYAIYVAVALVWIIPDRRAVQQR